LLAFPQFSTVAPRQTRAKQEVRAMTEPPNHHAALIYVMVTMSAVDRTMTDAELARIGEIVSHLPVFADFDQEQLVKTAQACGEVLSEDGGLERVLGIPRSSGRRPTRSRWKSRQQTATTCSRRSSASSTCCATVSTSTSSAGIERGIRARNTVL
jgi:hypothetical protein